MKDLLANYSVSEIIVFIVLLTLAVKELITLTDWIKNRLNNGFDKGYQAREEREEIREDIEELNNSYNKKEETDSSAFNKINEKFEKMDKLIDMLVESDKENIKAYITEKHHYFVYEKKWIDDYSLECLEKRFAIYEKEHGNSFVGGLMDEIRALPKTPPIHEAQNYVDTEKYIRNAKK